MAKCSPASCVRTTLGLFASSRGKLGAVIGVLKRVAWEVAGLQLRPEECTWAESVHTTEHAAGAEVMRESLPGMH